MKLLRTQLQRERRCQRQIVIIISWYLVPPLVLPIMTRWYYQRLHTSYNITKHFIHTTIAIIYYFLIHATFGWISPQTSSIIHHSSSNTSERKRNSTIGTVLHYLLQYTSTLLLNHYATITAINNNTLKIIYYYMKTTNPWKKTIFNSRTIHLRYVYLNQQQWDPGHQDCSSSYFISLEYLRIFQATLFWQPYTLTSSEVVLV